MMILPLGDKAFLLDLGGGVDTETLSGVRRVMSLIDAAAIPGVTDLVPGYTSIAVHFEPLVARRAAVEGAVRRLMEQGARESRETLQRETSETPSAAAPFTADVPEADARIVEIPVRYGGDAGPDLGAVASSHGLTPEKVVALHSAPTYTVHMIGFLPGFPYLGGLDPRLATPRRETPRTVVPAGSVGIGGAQTGVYPLQSPGGWHLIGHTELALFDPARTPPSLLQVGDRVRFVPLHG